MLKARQEAEAEAKREAEAAVAAAKAAPTTSAPAAEPEEAPQSPFAALVRPVFLYALCKSLSDLESPLIID